MTDLIPDLPGFAAGLELADAVGINRHQQILVLTRDEDRLGGLLLDPAV